MDTQFFAARREAGYTKLDPRTKLALVVTISTLMLGGGNTGAMRFVRPVLCIVPFLLLLSERRVKIAGKISFAVPGLLRG